MKKLRNDGGNCIIILLCLMSLNFILKMNTIAKSILCVFSKDGE